MPRNDLVDEIDARRQHLVRRVVAGAAAGSADGEFRRRRRRFGARRPRRRARTLPGSRRWLRGRHGRALRGGHGVAAAGASALARAAGPGAATVAGFGGGGSSVIVACSGVASGRRRASRTGHSVIASVHGERQHAARRRAPAVARGALRARRCSGVRRRARDRGQGCGWIGDRGNDAFRGARRQAAGDAASARPSGVAFALDAHAAPVDDQPPGAERSAPPPAAAGAPRRARARRAWPRRRRRSTGTARLRDDRAVVERPAVTKCTVQPWMRTPSASARRCVCRPGIRAAAATDGC